MRGLWKDTKPSWGHPLDHFVCITHCRDVEGSQEMHRGNNFSSAIDTQDMWVLIPDTRALTLGCQPLSNVNSGVMSGFSGDTAIKTLSSPGTQDHWAKPHPKVARHSRIGHVLISHLIGIFVS